MKVARIELMGKLQIKWPPSGPRDPDSKLPPITKRHSLAQLLPSDVSSPIDPNFSKITGIFSLFGKKVAFRVAVELRLIILF